MNTKQIAIRLWDTLVSSDPMLDNAQSIVAIEHAIDDAVKSEREACAQVAMRYSAEYHAERANHDAEAVKAMLKQAVSAAKNIANAIRSR